MEESRPQLTHMSVWEHIDALRAVILKAGAVLIVLTIAYFAVMPWLFDNVILAPCNSDFPLYKLLARVGGASPLMPSGMDDSDFHVSLINIKLASQFFIHMSTSFWLALVTAFPVVIYLIWGFVSPALYPSEKRGTRKAFLFGNIMFFIGVGVGYFLVFPLTLRFLAEYKVSELVPNQISLDSYMDNFLVLILVMGIVFELPLVGWLLGRMGVLSRRLFVRYRRHAIALLLILAAVITPTGDPFTLMVVFLPLYLLWEFTGLIVPKGQNGESSPISDDDDDSDSLGTISG